MRGWVCGIAIFLVAGIMAADSSKILLLPYGMYSHINIYTKLGKALLDDGHEVWVLAFDRYREKIEQKGLTALTYPLRPEDDLLTKIDEWIEADPEGGEGLMERFLSDDYWLSSNSRVCHSVMQNERLMTTIANEIFDLVVFDGVDEVLCFLMIPYKFDIPFITVHGFQLASWVSGVTGMPSIEPEMDKALSNRMDFWQRIDNLKSWMARYDSFYYDLYAHHMDNYCPAHKPKISFKELTEKAEMYLMNFEVICFEYPRVSAPNMQFLGASTATPAKPLPKDLEEYVASAEHGIVLLSLGSMKASHTIWKIMGPKMFEAFGRLQQKVIVQYRLDVVHGKVPPNVKLMKWIPQNDILGHPKTKLFINHGGNNGQNEAVYHAVPMLVIPFAMDQFYAGERVVARGYGNYVRDKKSITSDEFYQMMTEIMNNQKYSTNIKKCSGIIRSMPNAQEKFVFWVNHILQFGGAHLRPPSLDMPLYQVLMLDIFAYYILMGLAAIHAAIFLVYSVTKHLLRRFKPKKE